MKKLFYFFFAVIACTFAACSSDDEEPVANDLSFAEGVKNEVIYKDEVSISKGLTFTAPAAWNAVVNDISKTKSRADQGDCDWLKLDKYYGEAGTFTLHLTIEPNTGETTRTAKIIIKCNGTEISMIVEQKNVTKEEEENGGEVIPEAKFISQIIVHENHNSSAYKYSYDDKGRINKIQRNFYDNYDQQHNHMHTDTTGIIYSKNSIEEITYNNSTVRRDTCLLLLNQQGLTTDIDAFNKTMIAYKNNQLIKVLESYDIYKTTEDYTWENNKMVKMTSFGEGVKVECTITYGDIPCPTNFDLNSILMDISATYFGYPGVLYRTQINPKTGTTIFGTPIGGINGKMITFINVKETEHDGKVYNFPYKFKYIMKDNNIVKIIINDGIYDSDSNNPLSLEISYYE